MTNNLKYIVINLNEITTGTHSAPISHSGNIICHITIVIISASCWAGCEAVQHDGGRGEAVCPGTRVSMPGTRVSMPGTRVSMPGTRVSMPGTRVSMPGT